MPEVKKYTDYYPFGSLMPGRNSNSYLYQYGYQGSEKDDEIKGSGNSYTTEYRFLDSRLGRWLSIDPEYKPFESPYVSMRNTPIWHNDPLGNTDDKAVKSNPNNPNAKGGTQKFHNETTKLVSKNKNLQEKLGGDQGQGNGVTNGTQGLAAYGSYEFISSENVRTNYVESVSALNPLDRVGRTKLKMEARANTSPVMKSIVEGTNPSLDANPTSLNSANKTNLKATNATKVMGAIGKGLFLLNILNSAYNVSTAENKTKAVVEETGALAGGVGGGLGGAAVGTLICPVFGTIVGAVIGSWGGSEGGRYVGGKLYDSSGGTEKYGVGTFYNPEIGVNSIK